jgi:hypothetical protein
VTPEEARAVQELLPSWTTVRDVLVDLGDGGTIRTYVSHLLAIEPPIDDPRLQDASGVVLMRLDPDDDTRVMIAKSFGEGFDAGGHYDDVEVIGSVQVPA